jgi:hypothetical protein
MAAQTPLPGTPHKPPAGEWPIPEAVTNVFWRRFWSGVLLVIVMLAAAVVAGPAFGTNILPIF